MSEMTMTVLEYGQFVEKISTDDPAVVAETMDLMRQSYQARLRYMRLKKQITKAEAAELIGVELDEFVAAEDTGHLLSKSALLLVELLLAGDYRKSIARASRPQRYIDMMGKTFWDDGR